MKKFGLYQVYMGQDAVQLQSLMKAASANGRCVVGIDTHFYPPCLYEDGRSWHEQLKFGFDYVHSYLKWYRNHLLKGRMILPLPLICTLLDWLTPFHGSRPVSSSEMAADYQLSQRDDYSNELMATYIRFLCSLEEQFGLRPYSPWILSRFLVRARLYRLLLRFIFRLKPAIYVTWQRTYLQAYLPCAEAVRRHVPVAYLGSADGVPLRLSNSEVQRDSCWPVHAWPIVLTPEWSSERVVARRQINQQLTMRLQGGSVVDPLISYMPVNPYAAVDGFHPDVVDLLGKSNIVCISPGELAKVGSSFVVVYMHEFNDYHHDGVLAGFASSYYDWLLLTVLILAEHGVPYVVKVHPAILADPAQEKYRKSLLALISLADSLKVPLRVAASASTLDLLGAGMVLGCTVRGTVATELIHLRCPVICAGSPPYMNFMPQRVVSGLEDYRRVLIQYGDQPEVTDDECIANLDYLSGLGQVSPLSEEEKVLARDLGLDYLLK